jgi:hypothetical protein
MMCLLTDFVPSPLVRYTIGWFFIYVIYLQVGINTAFFLVDLYSTLKQLYKILRFKLIMSKRTRVVD